MLLCGKNNKPFLPIIKNLLNNSSLTLESLWGLNNNCKKEMKIFIGRSPSRFVFCTLPLLKKPLFLLLFPVWYFKSKENLLASGGITYDRNGRYFIFLKPPEMYSGNYHTDYQQIFCENMSDFELFRSTATRVVTEVGVLEQELPFWLRKGIITYAAEKCLKTNLVKKSSIDLLANMRSVGLNNFNLSNSKMEHYIYSYARGYWTVRYLEEEHPGFLKETFKSYKGEDVVRMIVEKLDLDTTDDEKMWIQLDELLYNHYEHLLETE